MRAFQLYGEETIYERHRHRYEVNNDYRAVLTEKGLRLSGTSPDGRIVEMCELTEHPFYAATQRHSELKSRPNRPHPLFKGFIAAALKNKMEKTKADNQKASLCYIQRRLFINPLSSYIINDIPLTAFSETPHLWWHESNPPAFRL